jgi:hypothetical protein
MKKFTSIRWTVFSMMLFPLFSVCQTEKPHVEILDDNDLKTGYRFDYWMDGAWESQDSSEYYYNEYNQLVEEIDKIFENGSWNLNRKRTYTYTDNNLNSEYLFEWTGIDWLNIFQDFYEYDANYNMILRIQLRIEDSVWVNNYRYTFEYDLNNNRISMLQELWGDSDWENFVYYTWEYNSQNLETIFLNRHWDGQDWIDFLRQLYEYDENNNKIISTRQNREGGFWVDYSRWLIDYNASNIPVVYQGEKWNGTEWINEWLDTHTCDEYWNLIAEDIKHWEENDWVNNYRNYFYYEIISGIKEPVNPGIPFTIFPNPCHGSLSVDSKDIKNSTLAFSIFTCDGRAVKSLITAAQELPKTLNLSNFPDGNYFIRLSDGEQQSIQKLVIIR